MHPLCSWVPTASLVARDRSDRVRLLPSPRSVTIFPPSALLGLSYAASVLRYTLFPASASSSADFRLPPPFCSLRAATWFPLFQLPVFCPMILFLPCGLPLLALLPSTNNQNQPGVSASVPSVALDAFPVAIGVHAMEARAAPRAAPPWEPAG